jgi:hypothetical protein
MNLSSRFDLQNKVKVNQSGSRVLTYIQFSIATNLLRKYVFDIIKVKTDANVFRKKAGLRVKGSNSLCLTLY